MDSTKLFTQTHPVKLFFTASIPGAVSMLASSLYQTLDGVFVGQFIGPTAFAAINLAMPFVIINFSLADLIGVGSSVPIAISLGEKKKERADNIFTCACLLILLTGILIGAAMYLAAPLLIRLMGAEGTFAGQAVQYLRICGYIRGSMFLNIFMSLLCGLLEILFLDAFGWGVWAAALAGCTGMFICALIALIPFFRGKALLRFCRPRFHLQMFRQILSCGSPNFLNNIAGRITSILMNAILVRLGGTMAVSVYGIMMFADGFIQPLLYGMCDSLQPAVGYNWGARKFSRVRAIERCCFLASAFISVLSALVLFIAPEQITRLFVPSPDPELLALAVTALQLFSITYLTRWFSFATQSYMLAVEKPLPATLISVSTALIFPVILIGVFWPLGLTGLWINMAGTSLLAALMSAVILRKLRQELHQPDAAG